MPVGVEMSCFSLTRCFLPQLRPPGAAGCTGPPAAGAAGHEAFLHTLPRALRPLGLEALTPSVTLAGAAATWTNTVRPNRSLRLPRSQELCKEAAVPGKGRVSPSPPPPQPLESSARDPPCSSGKEDSCPLPNRGRRARVSS